MNNPFKNKIELPKFQFKLRYIKEFMDGSLLTKDFFVTQLPYIFFLTFIAGVYITNRYHAEKYVKQSDKLKKEIKEIHSQSIAISSELMYLSNQTKISKLLKEKGIDIKEATVPPQKIVYKLKED